MHTHTHGGPSQKQICNGELPGKSPGGSQQPYTHTYTHGARTHHTRWSGGIDTVMMSSNEFKFLVEPDEDLKCMICLEVARDPLQHEECGKLFCKQCLEEYGRHKPCPNCRMRKSHYYVDKRGMLLCCQLSDSLTSFCLGKRTIDALRVECSNAKRRCDWQGTVGTVEKHVDTCQFTLVPCPKECKNDKEDTNLFMRKDLDNHLEKDCPNRDYQCGYCGVDGTYDNITKVHDKNCEKKTISCPNHGCLKIMQRCQISKHVADECQYTTVPCKYEIIGCGVQRERQDMAAHEQDSKLHLKMVMDAALESKSDSITLKKGDCMRFSLSGDQALGSAEPFYSPSFYTHPRGYRMTIAVYAKGHGDGEGSYISVFVKLLKGRYDSKVKWPFLGDVTVTLLNQLQDHRHHSLTVKFTDTLMARVGSRYGFSKYISHLNGTVATTVKQYLKDDTLYFRVSVALPSHKPSWLECGIQPQAQGGQPSQGLNYKK